MSTVTYDAWFPDVLPSVPGCDTITASNAIRSSCNAFCEQTHLYVYDADPIITGAGVATYDLDIPPQTNSVDILRLWVNGDEINPVPLDMQGVTNPEGISSKRPTGYVAKDFSTVTLLPTPDKEYTVTYKIAVTPSKASTKVDDFLYYNFFEEITWGALYRLLLVPGRSYSNPQLGAYYESKFRKAISDGKITLNRNRTRAQLQVQMRPRR